MRVCVAVDKDGKVVVSSRAELMALGELDGSSVRVEKTVGNPALRARERRPTFIRACGEAGAEAVIAAHGSFCVPSFAEARRLGLKLMVGDGPAGSLSLRRAGPWEAMYSSALAVAERLRGH